VSPKQIVSLRKALGLTQQQLADRIAANRVTIARWETGLNHPQGAYLKALTLLEASLKKKAKSVGKR
jgi:DNA-binding transcriptional regulator YiaG